jgi:hypothetical protein
MKDLADTGDYSALKVNLKWVSPLPQMRSFDTVAPWKNARPSPSVNCPRTFLEQAVAVEPAPYHSLISGVAPVLG